MRVVPGYTRKASARHSTAITQSRVPDLRGATGPDGLFPTPPGSVVVVGAELFGCDVPATGDPSMLGGARVAACSWATVPDPEFSLGIAGRTPGLTRCVAP